MKTKPDTPASAGEPPANSTAAPASAAEKTDFLALLAAPRAQPSWPPELTFVATCVDARHPTLRGRVEVSWAEASGATRRWWVPTLQGLALRSGDRVLLSRVCGLPEPIVVGVVDGFLPRPDPASSAGVTLEIRSDEVVTIVAQGGEPLVRICQRQGGPSIQLLCSDTELELPGRLNISAAELTLKARSGNVEIEASDQVIVSGETVQLN